MSDFWQNILQHIDPSKILSQGGFYVLLVVVFAETGLFFGFFLPGDYLLFLAGLFCATGKLDVNIYTLVISLILACLSGNYVGYWFGTRAGEMLFKRNDSFFFKKKHLEAAHKFYQKYGGMAVVLGRFLPVIRTFAPIFAGVVKLDFKKFSFFNILGGVIWVLVLVLLGYFLGIKYQHQMEQNLEWIVIGFVVVTALPLVFGYFRSRLHKKNIAENG